MLFFACPEIYSVFERIQITVRRKLAYLRMKFALTILSRDSIYAKAIRCHQQLFAQQLFTTNQWRCKRIGGNVRPTRKAFSLATLFQRSNGEISIIMRMQPSWKPRNIYRVSTDRSILIAS